MVAHRGAIGSSPMGDGPRERADEMVLDAFVRALTFFGGVPRRVIIDNPKSCPLRRHWFEPNGRR